MRIPDRVDAYDVLILAPIGPAGDLAHALGADLTQRGLVVKLNIISDERVLPLPAICVEDSRLARFCVAFGIVGTKTRYALLPAPRFPGQVPEVRPVGAKAGPGQVEIGVMTEEVAGFASRIEARLNG